MARKRQCSSSSASMAPPPPQPKVAATNNAPSSNQTKKHRQSDRQSELPHDLILEILPRLPVKSLLRFRCVCKTWDSLLYDPRFLKKHVSLARHRLLVNSRPIFLNSFQASNLLLDQPYTNSQVLRFPTNRKQYVRIIGSCYGLVCLKVFSRGNEAIYFWNPSTKQSIKLPYTCDVRECNIYGFGFADSTNEFKLVRVYIQSLNGWRRFGVEIFGMLDGSRRHLGIFPHGFPYTRTEGIFLNGAIHIVSVKSEKLLVDGVIITHTVWFIVALDLETETFRLLPQPDFVDDHEAFKCEEKSLSLYSVGELLCAVRSYKGSHGDVWVLKEYGVKESWVKLVRIPFLQVPRDNVDDWKPKPVYYYEKSGELLMIIRDDELVLYNANDNSFREIRLPGVNMKSKFYTQIKNHVDSLFAPGVMMRLRGETSHQNQQG